MCNIHVYTYGWVHVGGVRAHVWSPEMDLGCLHQSIFLLNFEQGLLLALGLTDWLERQGSLASSEDPPISSSSALCLQSYC